MLFLASALPATAMVWREADIDSYSGAVSTRTLRASPCHLDAFFCISLSIQVFT